MAAVASATATLGAVEAEDGGAEEAPEKTAGSVVGIAGPMVVEAPAPAPEPEPEAEAEADTA